MAERRGWHLSLSKPKPKRSVGRDMAQQRSLPVLSAAPAVSRADGGSRRLLWRSRFRLLAVVGFLTASMISMSCHQPGTSRRWDPEERDLVWVLKLVGSGRGCAYIESYLDKEGVSCVEVAVGSTKCPVLISRSGQRLSLQRFHSWYSMAPGDFTAEEDEHGVYFVEKHSGTAFRMSDGKLSDFWLTCGVQDKGCQGIR